MADASIPVDLFNPGQVFACLGLMEAADTLLGHAQAAFDWSDEADTRFLLRAAGDSNPVEEVLSFLAGAEVVSRSPAPDALSTDKWKVPTYGSPQFGLEEDQYPFRSPNSPATLVAVLQDPDAPARSIEIDYWGDTSGRDNAKFWAGSGGYPGAALLRDALDLVRNDLTKAADDPFALTAPQSSSFRFDWRRDYIPLDAGFSPNEHGDVVMTGYPAVEVLAAIGMGAARPHRPSRSDKLAYRYGVIAGHAGDTLFPPSILRAALGASELPFNRRVFRMTLGWPGQEGQARCIIDVNEEPTP